MKQFRMLMAVTVLALFTLTACSSSMDVAVDASSMDSYKKSVDAIKKELKPGDRERLEESLKALATPASPAEEGAMVDVASAEADFLKSVNGKTARQIIAMAADRVKVMRQKELEVINLELAMLEEKRAAYESAKELLTKVTISEASYYWKKGVVSTPVLDFKVANNTDAPLSKIFFNGTVAVAVPAPAQVEVEPKAEPEVITEVAPDKAEKTTPATEGEKSTPEAEVKSDLEIKPDGEQAAEAKGDAVPSLLPVRHEPVVSKSFNYRIPSGLAVGETKHLVLTPGASSVWAAEAAKDKSADEIILSIEVVNAQNAEGAELVSEFSKDDEARLAELTERKKQLDAK